MMGRRCVIAPRCVGQRGGARNELRPGRANTGERERESKNKNKKHMWPYWVDWADTWTVTKVKVPVKTNTDSSKQPKSAIHPYLMHRIVHCQCNFIHSFKKKHDPLIQLSWKLATHWHKNLSTSTVQPTWHECCTSLLLYALLVWDWFPPTSYWRGQWICLFFYREAIYKLRLILKSTNQAIPLDFVILRSFFFIFYVHLWKADTVVMPLKKKKVLFEDRLK